MVAIYKKELKSYFSTLYGYIFIAILLLVSGIFFTLFNIVSASPQFEAVAYYTSIAFVLIVPILTMRVIAGERSQKTDILLDSLPLSAKDVIMGKYLALLTVFAIPSVVISFYPLIISMFGKINLAMAYTAIAGFVLLGAALIALGLFVSSLTKSQILSAVLCFAFIGFSVLLDLFYGYVESFLPSGGLANVIILSVCALLIGAIAYFQSGNLMVGMLAAIIIEVVITLVCIFDFSLMTSAFAMIIKNFAFFNVLRSFLGGTFSISAVVYYLVLTAAFLFLSLRSLDRKRWN